MVIGAGTAGLVAAAGAAGLGAKVGHWWTVIYGRRLPRAGCVPSKSLIKASRAVWEIRKAPHYGVNVDNYRVDFPAVMERVRRIRSEISHNDAARASAKWEWTSFSETRLFPALIP